MIGWRSDEAVFNVGGMNWLRLACILVALSGVVPVAAEDTAELAKRVIILANAADPESRRLAEHYASARGVPRDNIVALPLAMGETIGWSEFVTTLFNPLQGWLVERDWVDGIGMDLTDEYGRRKYAMSGHRISYLVVCKGVPLRIDNHGPWLENEIAQRLPAPLRTNGAAVDAELTVLAASGTPVNGFIPNPLYGRAAPEALRLGQIVRVSRLDGPNFAVARALVDDALRVEQEGLIGRAVVDVRGPFPQGDAWVEAAGKTLGEAGWEVMAHTADGTLPTTARADAIAWYFGWYTGGVNGPFALPGFRFAPGAIALHIHSFSAQSLRLESGGGWTGPLVARGAAASFGNVAEPYLEFTHRPEMLAAALLRGARLGEAIFEALPVLSWQAMAIGDPLYRPLAVDLAAQVAGRERLSLRYSSYVVEREMLRLEAAGEVEEALRVGRAALRETPSLALALAVARRLHASGEEGTAKRALEVAKWVTRAPAEDWGLMAEVAETLRGWGEPGAAVAVWRTLFGYDLPNDVRRAWLTPARDTATEARDTAQALEWGAKLIELTPIPPAPAT